MPFRFGDYGLDAERRELRQGTDLVAVEPQVFDLLIYLMRHRHRVVSKDDLIVAIWGGRIVSESTLTTRINAARRAIGDSGARQELIRTIARKGFRFVAEVTETSTPGPEAAVRNAGPPAELPQETHPAVPDRPSIAVLPFTNLDGDREQEYLVDGVVEDIITGLSRARWLFVIARNSSFAYKGRACDVKQVARELGVRYVLDGSMRKAGDRIRISVQLLDGNRGGQVWAHRYDRDLVDIFALQDEITETIIGAVEPELGKLERMRATMKRPESLDAWDLYQHGMWHLYQYTKDDLVRARTFFQQAIDKDPRLGSAYSGIAEAYYYEGVYGFADSISGTREQALEPALRAVALDPEDAGAHCTLGRAHYMRRTYDASIRELNAALQLNPSLALAHYGLGAALVFSGRSQDAIPHLTRAIRLSPYDPNMGSFLVRLADAAFFARNYEEAAEWAKRALHQPNFQWSRYTVLIAALARLGKLDEAAQSLQQLRMKRPDVSLAFVRQTHLFGDPDDFAHYLEALRAAGLR